MLTDEIKLMRQKLEIFRGHTVCSEIKATVNEVITGFFASSYD